MRLWTEYEGETIDGVFPLKQLLLPEGRSAFFTTANAKGDPALLRLIECHFDEDEILARWRTVEALNHPNFLRLERYGQIELDGNPAVYAIFEKADANLGGVLAQGHLSAKETADLAASLIAALEMLHEHGFVHEHVTPQSIFAVGEVVKLRSDCIREAPEGQAGRDAKQRDVQDLARVLLQTLTERTSLEGLPASALPPPLDAIVRNGLNGSWGLAEMRAALASSRYAAPGPTRAAKPAAVTPPASQSAPSPGEPAQAAKPVAAGQPRPAKPRPESALPSAIHQVLLPRRKDESFSWWREWTLQMRRSRWLGVAGMVAVVALLAALAIHIWSGHRHTGEPATAASAPAVAHAPHKAGAVVARHTPARISSDSVPVTRLTQHKDRSSRTEWRVIAYTYNRPEDARKKAASIARSHPGLQPQVFTPTGHAPYLVAVGGVMDRDKAVALAHSLRGRGLPRDTYAQNY